MARLMGFHGLGEFRWVIGWLFVGALRLVDVGTSGRLRWVWVYGLGRFRWEIVKVVH